MRERLLKTGLEPSPNTPDEYDEFIRAEVVRLGKVVTSAGIRLE